MSFWVRESKQRKKERETEKVKDQGNNEAKREFRGKGKMGCLEVFVRVMSFHSQAHVNMNCGFSIY